MAFFLRMEVTNEVTHDQNQITSLMIRKRFQKQRAVTFKAGL